MCQYFDTTSVVEREINHIQYNTNTSVILFDDMELSNIYFTPEQIGSNKLHQENAFINFRMFMINSLTMDTADILLTQYRIQETELLFLPGYWYEDDGDIKINLFIDKLFVMKTSLEVTSLQVEPNSTFPLFNKDDEQLIDDYTFNYGNNAITGLNNQANGDIPIERCYMKTDLGIIIIKSIPLNIMPDSKFQELIGDISAEIFQDILSLTSVFFEELDGKLEILTEHLNFTGYTISNDNLKLLYKHAGDKSVFFSKLTTNQIYVLVKNTNFDKSQLSEVNRSNPIILKYNMDKIQNLPFSDMNDLLEELQENEIDDIINTPDRINKVTKLTPQEISENLSILKPNYLKLLLKKLSANEKTELANLIVDINVDNLPVLRESFTADERYEMAKKLIGKIDGQQMSILIDDFDHTRIFALLQPTTPDYILNVLNSKPALLDTLVNIEITTLIDLLINGNVVKNLNNDVITKLEKVDIEKIINSLEFGDVLVKLDADSRFGAHFTQPQKDKFTGDLINYFTTNGNLPNKDTLAAFKLSNANYSTIENALINNQILLLDEEQINEIEEHLTSNECKVIYDRVAASPNLTTEKLVVLTKRLDSADWFTAVSVLNNARVTAIINSLDAAEIEAKETTLTSAQCLEIYNKIDNVTTLEPEKLVVLTKRLDSADWFTAVSVLDKARVTAIINSLDAAEIEAKEATLTPDQCVEIYILVNDPNSLQNEKFFSLIKNLPYVVWQPIVSNFDDTKMTALITSLNKSEVDRRMAEDRSHGLAGLRLSRQSGGKTRRSNVKKNITRRL